MPLYYLDDARGESDTRCAVVVADTPEEARELAAQNVDDIDAETWRTSQQITIEMIGEPTDRTPRFVICDHWCP